MADSHLHESNFKRFPKLVKLYFKRNTITIKYSKMMLVVVGSSYKFSVVMKMLDDG